MMTSAAQRILTAVQEILMSRGIEEVSIRNVAAAAGVSVGAVQHHYKTKDELLMAAMDQVSEAFVADVTAVLDPDAPARSNLEAVCRILGSVDAESRPASVIWLAYASKAATSDAVARAHRQSWRLMEQGLTALLQRLDPAFGADDAALLMAFLDGLAVARATESDRMTPERAQRLLDRFLGQLRP
ncbi:TetR family transcriptional regulator C-terminal domain-containing protein [Arthrobacter sp. ATA002]|uniref:TetR/AcrR family transcriptional regulator n=1 Tax=Arthrobacter sp. ATA002 TaxID=2991715 RepID=UPI0022A7E1A6|nr:TetR family transcriptional regulator C-terminal domain-containing protein [Arthrobacter sp. ATA002]WAP50702.1 TetR family transcriptional regulator C-terminal domain-containing protein [Arthrobacter sp. ATA002]